MISISAALRIAAILAPLLAAGGGYTVGRIHGYQAAVDDRAEAVQRAKDRANEATEETDRLSDDDLLNGIVRP